VVTPISIHHDQIYVWEKSDTNTRFMIELPFKKTFDGTRILWKDYPNNICSQNVVLLVFVKVMDYHPSATYGGKKIMHGFVGYVIMRGVYQNWGWK
jgi:hypothetical protein